MKVFVSGRVTVVGAVPARASFSTRRRPHFRADYNLYAAGAWAGLLTDHPDLLLRVLRHDPRLERQVAAVHAPRSDIRVQQAHEPLARLGVLQQVGASVPRRARRLANYSHPRAHRAPGSYGWADRPADRTSRISYCPCTTTQRWGQYRGRRCSLATGSSPGAPGPARLCEALRQGGEHRYQGTARFVVRRSTSALYRWPEITRGHAADPATFRMPPRKSSSARSRTNAAPTETRLLCAFSKRAPRLVRRGSCAGSSPGKPNSTGIYPCKRYSGWLFTCGVLKLCLH